MLKGIPKHTNPLSIACRFPWVCLPHVEKCWTNPTWPKINSLLWQLKSVVIVILKKSAKKTLKTRYILSFILFCYCVDKIMLIFFKIRLSSIIFRLFDKENIEKSACTEFYFISFLCWQNNVYFFSIILF